MRGESLAGLKAAFDDWRIHKRHVREAYPTDLLARARVAARRHGSAAVARATKVDQGRLTGPTRGKAGARPASAEPTFSRLQLAVPAPAQRPFAEILAPSGLAVRLFTPTDEALAWLASLVSPRGAP
jgi:hypothetical protein